MQAAQQHITALVLAGGQGSRMGGLDKGLQLFRGRPLVDWAIHNVRPQVQSVWINANRNLDTYRALADRVVTDIHPDFAGPLAGMAAGLAACPTEWMVTLPCDSPFLPTLWVERLWQAARMTRAQLVMVSAPERSAKADVSDSPSAHPLRKQPVFCLMHRSLGPSLDEALSRGERKIDRWTTQSGCLEVPFVFDNAHPWDFVNINTLDDLGALEHQQLP